VHKAAGADQIGPCILKKLATTIIDFSKSFDKVSHVKLVQKLHYYGIKSFLTNRK
jgi:hypothetical protein